MIIKIKNKLLKHLFCPLTSVIGAIFVYNMIIASNHINYQRPVIIRDNIIPRIHSYINECQQGYWFSWVVIEDNIFSFVDVMGYNPSSGKEDKVFSVKYSGLNEYYLKEHTLDINTIEWMTRLDTGYVGYYDIKALEVYTAITDSIIAANLNLYSIGIGITKNSKERLIYIFTITSSNKELMKCDKLRIVNILGELSIYAKTQL